MPELPEIEHLRQSLAPLVLGATVERVRVGRRDVIHPHRGPTGRMLLHGGTIDRLLRHGKQLAIVAVDGRCICIHLGMSGQLLWVPEGRALLQADHVHCTWALARGGRRGRLVFRDPRRFGSIRTYADLDSLRADRWEHLGPDALKITAHQLRNRLAGRSRPVKSALLDQSILAGVGNIYADEALFRAQIHPVTPCLALTQSQMRTLAGTIRTVMRRAVRAGGSTLRDYVDANGRSGRFAIRHLVYGRAREPCQECATLLLSTTLAQRTTVFCPTCQPSPEARAIKG